MATLELPGTSQRVMVPDNATGFYLEKGWVVAGTVRPRPDASWKGADLRAYADAHRIDIKGLRVKRDLLDAIEAAESSEAG